MNCQSAPLKPDSSIDREVAASTFPDSRLGKRFRSLVEHLSHGIGEPIPFACQDWSNAKAAYRFFSNPRVNEEALLSGHFQATASRSSMTQGPVLILHDTTEFSFNRENPEAIGVRGKNLTVEIPHCVRNDRSFVGRGVNDGGSVICYYILKREPNRSMKHRTHPSWRQIRQSAACLRASHSLSPSRHSGGPLL
jgi:hypothetical protein